MAPSLAQQPLCARLGIYSLDLHRPSVVIAVREEAAVGIPSWAGGWGVVLNCHLHFKSSPLSQIILFILNLTLAFKNKGV